MRTHFVIGLSCAIALGACGTDTSTVTMGLAGLDDLGSDHVYEGWLIVDGAPVSAGRFSVDADGNPTPASFELDAAMVAAATTYVLTIEPATGDDPGPSSTHILAGDIAGSTASLSVGHAAALGTDFASAAGEYILETPSSMAVMDDYDQGIWWLIPGAAGAAPGLTLPALPDGWVYEGWVVGASGPVSTGTFSAASGADSDATGPTAGPDSGPPFPGQDFVDPAMVLTSGTMAVISVEPVPDNSPMPFTIKPLADMDVQDTMAPATQSMNNIAAMTVPSGTISFEL